MGELQTVICILSWDPVRAHNTQKTAMDEERSRTHSSVHAAFFPKY